MILGCTNEVAFDQNDFQEESYENTPLSSYRDYEGYGSCQVYVRELKINGQTIVVYEPVNCPQMPSLEEVMINPVEEHMMSDKVGSVIDIKVDSLLKGNIISY
jgi:hypothetical protein